MPTLGDGLREAREFLGLPLDLVAAKLGLAAADIAAMEADGVEPTTEQLDRFVRLYGRPVERLRGAPLDLGLAAEALICGPVPPTTEELALVAQFAEFLQHADPPNRREG